MPGRLAMPMLAVAMQAPSSTRPRSAQVARVRPLTRPGAAPPTRPVPQERPLDPHVLLEVWMPRAPQFALALPAPQVTSQPQEPAAQQMPGRLAMPMLAVAMQAPSSTRPRSAQVARVRPLTKPGAVQQMPGRLAMPMLAVAMQVPRGRPLTRPGAAPPTRPVPQERPVGPHVLLEVWMPRAPQVALALPAPQVTSQPQEPAVMLSRLLLRRLQLLLQM